MKKIIIPIIFIACISLVSAQSAMEFYLEGEDHLLYLTEEDNAKAISAFQQAISIDSDFSHAYAGLSKAYAQKYQYFDSDEKWYNLTIQNAQIAQSIDPLTYDVPEVHIALTRVYAENGEDKKAEKEYARMLTLYPEYEGIYPDLNDVLDEQRPVSLEEKSNMILIILAIVIVIIIAGGFYLKYRKHSSH